MVRELMEFDDSQMCVIEAEIEARRIITAAAGQGKTEVVVARLDSLREQGLDVMDDVLILSFSRAAVDTVRKRSEQNGVFSVEARTFDSFAGKVLLEAGELETVRGGFDARIRRATELIKGDELVIDQYEHVIIDESQDLVGDRAEMALALMAGLGTNAGFTVLGDPLQGIYDFQLDDNVAGSALTSAEFLNILIEEYGAEKVALTGHYRAMSERTLHIVSVGHRLREMMENGTDPTSAHALLDEYRVNGGPDGPYRKRSLDRLTGYLDDLDIDETAAVLTTTNYEALLTSEALGEMGIHHVVRRRAQDAGVARWVGALLQKFEIRKYTHKEFDETANAVPIEIPVNAWDLLKEVENDVRDHRTLNIQSVNRRMRNVGVPLALTPQDKAGVAVSTVHRAKGLQFDYVIDVEPPRGSPGSALTYPNLRRRYVASSRPRHELFVLQPAEASGSFAKIRGGRWVEYRFGKGGKPYPARIEITNDDIETEVPCVPESDDPRVGQSALLTRDLLGEKVDLVLLGAPVKGNEAHYWVKSETGEILGRTSCSFGKDVCRELMQRHLDETELNWPKRLDGARIVSIETVAGDPELTKSLGIGPSGFWQVPRLSGLVRAVWKTEEGNLAK